jgi:carbon-monoxide dehydrogenase large subunit
MDDHIDPTTFGLDDRFAIGQPVPRSEDPVLLRGEGRYSDDVSLPGQAYAVMVRSHHAHGVIRGIDTAAAHAMPGGPAAARRRGSRRNLRQPLGRS